MLCLQAVDYGDTLTLSRLVGTLDRSSQKYKNHELTMLFGGYFNDLHANFPKKNFFAAAQYVVAAR
jgi:hypothetical protein